jgi:hypothetical protein
MQDVKTVQDLAGAASYLCSAAEELAAAGYEVWGTEVKQLLEIIAAEIAWLQARDTPSVV